MNNLIKSFKNKFFIRLQKDKGATIVFALVVFMIAAIVSVTIVNLALTNLGRSHTRKSNEPARLAAVSAAKYLESNDASLNASLTAAAVNEVWTVSVSGDSTANAALSTTIKWTDVSPDSSMTAVIKSGGYSAEVRIIYDVATGKWSISRFKKI